jgi:hypothetical protein
MLDKSDIKRIARARLKDAKVLADKGRFEAAIYLCGYAVELGLKGRICRTLKWEGWPEGNEFHGYQSFKTHNLDVLLHLSGIEERIKTKLFAAWSIVATWDPESRYNPVGKASELDAYLTIVAAKVLLDVL